MERKDFFKNYKSKIKGKQATMEIKLASFFKMKHNYCVYGMSIEFLKYKYWYTCFTRIICKTMYVVDKNYISDMYSIYHRQRWQFMYSFNNVQNK